MKKGNVLFCVGRSKERHGLDKILNLRRSRKTFYVPKCVESMLGNFLEKHDISFPKAFVVSQYYIPSHGAICVHLILLVVII